MQEMRNDGVHSPVIPADRVISMTELQKLSLRRLRELRLAESPLIVRDVKRGRGRFVILDHEVWVRLAGGAATRHADTGDLLAVDFAGRGLLWDRPEMTNADFVGFLANPDRPDGRWAWRRLLERLPSDLITRTVPLPALRRILDAVRPGPRMRAAWEAALEFWTTEARDRIA
jgi:hypothetical protein